MIVSDTVVNWKAPRLFLAGDIGDTRPSVRYLMKVKKERFRERLQAVFGIYSKTFASKTIFKVEMSDTVQNC